MLASVQNGHDGAGRRSGRLLVCASTTTNIQRGRQKIHIWGQPPISAPLASPLCLCGCNSRWQFFAPARPSCCRLSCANRIFMFRFWPAGTALARVAGCGPRVGRAAGLSCLPDPAIPLHALSSVTQVREQIGSSNFFFCIILGLVCKTLCHTLARRLNFPMIKG